jgi:hypothetical protein
LFVSSNDTEFSGERSEPATMPKLDSRHPIYTTAESIRGISMSFI